jgi:hypothetical protein
VAREQVIEYPWWQELPADLGERVNAFDDSREFGGESYYSVSQAPGWKAGGYASWGGTDLILMQQAWGDPEWMAATEPTGVTVGRYGQMRIFTCSACPGKPIRLNIQ